MLLFLMGVSIVSYSQGINENNVLVKKNVITETTISLESITNNSPYDIELTIRGNNGKITKVKIKKGDTYFDNIACENIYAASTGTSQSVGSSIWNKAKTKKAWEELQEYKETIIIPDEAKTDVTIDEEKSDPTSIEVMPQITSHKEKTDSRTVFASFKRKYDKDPYWSISSIESDEKIINDHIEALNNWTDRNAYIQGKNLEKYLREEGKKLDKAKESIDDLANEFKSYYKDVIIDESEFYCFDSIKFILKKRAEKREIALNKLREAINTDESSVSLFDFSKLHKQTIINIVVIVGVILFLFIWFVLVARKREKENKQKHIQHQHVQPGSPTIVVRRKTTSILKKQSLEDVIGNKAYMKIECADFCSDSAVRRMYIKNTCIKDIYNMYAEDLRNPDNPKEDGCMVLGRWVLDHQTNEYYVSLEEIVQPGDDAVFQEYELNFGGKIKLKVAEKLRKLRRESNLQYDLTCWVHSHPGLGVFFSNSDANVQMQLKHPSHPNFLTAIVVDILTPQQEFGIFTFKHDSTINSKNDLNKMYSLEELHKWAVESDRYSFKAEDYYNTLSKSEDLYEECKGVQLNNSAIIDMCSITTEPTMGLVAWAHGYMTMSYGKKEFIVTSITKSESTTDDDMLGCLVIGTHCSIPSIRKTISAYSSKVNFVLFYSISQETLTTIPVIDMELSTDEKFYCEEKLEDLKIWTRRKR